MTKVTVLDGSFSSQVSCHVDKSADGDPLRTTRILARKPDAIVLGHLDFLRAGSDVIVTNTYQASVEGFSKYLGTSESGSLELIEKAVCLAFQAVKIYKEEFRQYKDAVNASPKVAGSCGPYGATLHDGSEYTGSYGKSISPEFLKEWHFTRLELLIRAGIDFLAFETIPCVEEAEVLIDLLKDFPQMKAWLSFSCSNDGKTISDGTDFKDIAIKCFNTAPDQLMAVGINCVSPSIVSSYLAAVNGSPEGKNIPLIVYPNSIQLLQPGEECKDGEYRGPGIEKYVHEWLGLGVQFIGGCCRTGALDIAKIRGQVESWRSQERETSV